MKTPYSSYMTNTYHLLHAQRIPSVHFQRIQGNCSGSPEEFIWLAPKGFNEMIGGFLRWGVTKTISFKCYSYLLIFGIYLLILVTKYRMVFINIWDIPILGILQTGSNERQPKIIEPIFNAATNMKIHQQLTTALWEVIFIHSNKFQSKFG